MNQKHHEIITGILNDASKNHADVLELYPGIELSFFSLAGKETAHFRHVPLAQILEINYCISGRMGWKMSNGNQVHLGAGDFSLNTMDVCGNSTINLPNGSYEGLAIYIDLRMLSYNAPAPLMDANITGELLLEKYCKNGICTALAANETIQRIFEALYQPPKEVRLSYQKIKVLELLLVLSQMKVSREKHLTEYRSEQVEVIRQIHSQLVNNLEQRYSIESLSRQYLMNPTTLKNMFKSIYGTSIATHIREHRMEYAAQLLQSSSLSITDISLKAGYSSQSRFSSAFKKQYQMLPKEYRQKYLERKSDP